MSLTTDQIPGLDNIRNCTTGGKVKPKRQVLSIPEVKSVLLIGGCGFLGHHLIEEFWRVTPRPEIHVLDIRPLDKSNISPTFFTFDPDQIHTYTGDITSPEDLQRVLKEAKPQVVVHSVSPVHGLGAEIYHKVNVLGTRNIIKETKLDPNVQLLVYTSSAGVVFNGADLKNVDESIPYPAKAMDAYNETKAIAEDEVLSAATSYDNFVSKSSSSSFAGELLTVSLRPAGIFGPGDRQMIPELRKMPYRGQHKFQLGSNNNLFDTTYVGNVAFAHALATQKIFDPKIGAKVNGQCFFITNNSPIYFWAMGRAVWKADGFVDPPKFVIPKGLGIFIGYISEFVSNLTGKPPGLTPFRVRTVCANRYYNISKAESILGYRPQTDLESGILETLKWLDELDSKKN